MSDSRDELFRELNPEEKDQILEAETASEVILARGAEAVKERSFSAEIWGDRDWVLEPQDRARSDAASNVFLAYEEVFWQKVDFASPDSVEKFFANLNTAAGVVLERYGTFEGGKAVSTLLERAARRARMAFAQRQVRKWDTADIRDADFWRSRRADFDGMATRQTSSLGGSQDPRWLVGRYDYRGAAGASQYCEVRGGLDGRLRDFYEEVAAHAGIELGCPIDVSPSAFWLHCLCQDLLHSSPSRVYSELSFQADGSGIIHDLLGSSAGYCSRLAAKARRPSTSEGVPSQNAELKESKPIDPEVLDQQTAPHAEKPRRPSGLAEFEDQRQAELEKTGLALGAIERGENIPTGLADPEFWERRQAEFEKYSSTYADLAVEWRAFQGWSFLMWGEKPVAMEAPKEWQRTFNALARKSLEGVPPLAALNVEPWHAWLEFMHFRRWPFEINTYIPGSVQRQWNSAVKDGITRFNFGDEVKYGRDEPDQWQFGLLLKRVFQASALFCLELSAGANAIAEPISQRIKPDLPPDSGDAAQVLPKRRGTRGRKTIFTPEQLNEARQMKIAGKINNEIAKILYATNTPTPGQRRSVSTTLKHHFGPKK